MSFPIVLKLLDSMGEEAGFAQPVVFFVVIIYVHIICCYIVIALAFAKSCSLYSLLSLIEDCSLFIVLSILLRRFVVSWISRLLFSTRSWSESCGRIECCSLRTG